MLPNSLYEINFHYFGKILNVTALSSLLMITFVMDIKPKIAKYNYEMNIRNILETHFMHFWTILNAKQC